jgi:hypothetical protein
MYGVSRIDDEIHNTHAWRVSLRRQGKLHVKNFPDRKHSGKGKALKLAKVFRDELIQKYPPMTRKQFCSIVRGNNKTGISGVYTYNKSYVLRDGTVKKTGYWEANWPNEDSESVSASFSIKTYGEAKAKQLAIRARKQGLRTVEGVFWASARGAIENA